jgi:hypothetical protein
MNLSDIYTKREGENFFSLGVGMKLIQQMMEQRRLSQRQIARMTTPPLNEGRLSLILNDNILPSAKERSALEALFQLPCSVLLDSID